MRELLTLYFRKKGFTVTTAITSQEALALARETCFQLAILDVNLAGENGLGLLSLLRAQYPELPIIMFTGQTDAEALLEKALARGANGFMRKTQSLEELLTAVRRHLP